MLGRQQGLLLGEESAALSSPQPVKSWEETRCTAGQTLDTPTPNPHPAEVGAPESGRLWHGQQATVRMPSTVLSPAPGLAAI